VVNLICSFASAENLVNLRLVNRLFYREATTQLRSRHKPIFLDEINLRPFLECVQARLEPQNKTFPFGTIKFRLSLSDENIELLMTEVGKHIRGLEILLDSEYEASEFAMQRERTQAKQKLALILPKVYRNLEYIYIYVVLPVSLDPGDLKALPTHFPKLRNIGVGILLGDYKGIVRSSPQGLVPLLSYFISRSPVLDKVALPEITNFQSSNDSLNAIQVIGQHHQHHLPAIQLTQTVPISINVVRELTRFEFKFGNFYARLCSHTPYNQDYVTAAQEAQNIMKCVEWLGSQSAQVTSLVVDIWKTRHSFTFKLPPLAALRKLFLGCDRIEDNECPMQPLESNQFPVLSRLTLLRNRDNFGIFQRCSLPTVLELDIQSQLTPLSAPWHTILPNLTTLEFMVSDRHEGGEEDENNLAFLLRHFPRITQLKLMLGSGSEHDFWDVLTGGARRPQSTQELLHGELGGGTGDPEEPLDGVFQTASLQNLRCKQSISQ